MDREILYRGKRTDNGEWETGSLVSVRQGCTDEQIFIADKMTEFNTPVLSSTVGQYTGLTDKNGKKIFEGDIIKTKKYGKIIAHSNVSDYDIFEVVYEPAIFRLKNFNRAFNLVGNCGDYEIIGNIHDTPELLEVI